MKNRRKRRIDRRRYRRRSWEGSRRSRERVGYTVLIGAMAMMAGLIAVDVNSLMNWYDAMKPSFVGAALVHFSVVGAAFAGGKIIPVAQKRH